MVYLDVKLLLTWSNEHDVKWVAYVVFLSVENVAGIMNYSIAYWKHTVLPMMIIKLPTKTKWTIIICLQKQNRDVACKKTSSKCLSHVWFCLHICRLPNLVAYKTKMDNKKFAYRTTETLPTNTKNERWSCPWMLVCSQPVALLALPQQKPRVKKCTDEDSEKGITGRDAICWNKLAYISSPTTPQLHAKKSWGRSMTTILCDHSKEANIATSSQPRKKIETCEQSYKRVRILSCFIHSDVSDHSSNMFNKKGG